MQTILKCLDAVRANNPLVLNLTNYVVTNNTANALLAVGASPIMSFAQEELDDLLTISGALVINIGTLHADWIAMAKTAMRLAAEKHVPIVLDPVGVGASQLRTKTVTELLSIAKPAVIRGNASETLALNGAVGNSKGVDSTAESGQAITAAQQLAAKYDCVVVISGATDYCCTTNEVVGIANGDAMMTQVTGMGCTATAVVGACIAVEKNALIAAQTAMAVMGVAGEIAAQQSQGPGSLAVNFLDQLSQLSASQLQSYIKLDTAYATA